MFDDYLANLSYKMRDLFEHLESTFTTDNSGYIYVDGEEGDLGVIKYASMSGEIVAIKTLYGGDCETVEFTPYGEQLLKLTLSRFVDNL